MRTSMLVFALAAPAAAQLPSTAQAPPAPAPPPAQAWEAAPPDSAEALKREIDVLDARIRAGLAELDAALGDLDAQRASWGDLDGTVASAIRVNEALLARCDQLIAIYELQIDDALGRYRADLEAAPKVYRAMAGDRRARAAAATRPTEREAYARMADMAEAAAVLCERRHRETFESPGDEAPSNADMLAESMEAIRSMKTVHLHWRDTLAAWPSILDSPELRAVFDHMRRYAEDLARFSRGVTEMVDAMQDAAEGPPAAAAPGIPAPNPAPAQPSWPIPLPGHAPSPA